jgi:uncharacterized protein YqfB (UPF0267 family)
MPTINFQERFAPDVESGRKRQTIRKRSQRRWQIGDTLYLYTGQRTHHCRLLGTATIRLVRLIFIDTTRESIVLESWDAPGHPCLDLLSVYEARALARADGFATLDEFFVFFERTHGPRMSGHLISW